MKLSEHNRGRLHQVRAEYPEGSTTIKIVLQWLATAVITIIDVLLESGD